MKIGITGQSGFVGTHLYNYVKISNELTLVDFSDEYFKHEELLDSFVKQCDCIVHLAAVNRHEDQQELFKINIDLVQKLIHSCERTNSRPQIIFSSSTQESQDNAYGRSKKRGRGLLSEWAEKTGANLISLTIPNVYGPFGKPFHNSVISTFCHQISHNETPKIKEDRVLNLIYVDELVKTIYELVKSGDKKHPDGEASKSITISCTSALGVSKILETLNDFKTRYYQKYEIPDLTTKFRLNLFNTFRCFMPNHYYPIEAKLNSDERGAFVELVRAESPGQTSFSITRPGITRGNHFHTRKAERFAVVKGEAVIKLRKYGTSEVVEYYLNGDKPSFVDMPIWYMHNIKNIGKDDLYTVFWISEPYNPEDPDTYFEEVE